MAAYYAGPSLDGFAHWLRVQSEEEQTHGLRLFDLILARGGPIAPGALALKRKRAVSPCGGRETAVRTWGEPILQPQR